MSTAKYSQELTRADDVKQTSFKDHDATGEIDVK